MAAADRPPPGMNAELFVQRGDGMLAPRCRTQNLELHMGACKDEFDLKANLSYHIFFNDEKQEFDWKLYGDELVEGIDGRQAKLAVHAEGKELLQVPAMLMPKSRHLRRTPTEEEACDFLAQLATFCDKHHRRNTCTADVQRLEKLIEKAQQERQKIKEKHDRAHRNARVLHVPALNAADKRVVSTTGPLNIAKELCCKFESLAADVATLRQFGPGWYNTLLANGGDFWFVIAAMLRTQRVPAMKLLMYRALDMTYCDPSVSLSTYVVAGLKEEEVLAVGNMVFEKVRAGGLAVENLGHDGAYSTMRNKLNRVSTREAVAAQATLAAKDAVDTIKASKRPPWVKISNRVRQATMKEELAGLICAAIHPDGRPKTTLRSLEDFDVMEGALAWPCPQRCDDGAPLHGQQQPLTDDQKEAFFKSFHDSGDTRCPARSPKLEALTCKEFTTADIVKHYPLPGPVASEVERALEQGGFCTVVGAEEVKYMKAAFSRQRFVTLADAVARRLVLVDRAVDIPEITFETFELELAQTFYEATIHELKHDQDPRDLERYTVHQKEGTVKSCEDNLHCCKRCGYAQMRQVDAIGAAMDDHQDQNMFELLGGQPHKEQCVNPLLCGICGLKRAAKAPYDSNMACDSKVLMLVALENPRFAHIGQLYTKQLDVQRGSMQMEPFFDPSYHAAVAEYDEKSAVFLQVMGGAFAAFDQSHLQEDFRDYSIERARYLLHSLLGVQPPPPLPCPTLPHACPFSV